MDLHQMKLQFNDTNLDEPTQVKWLCLIHKTNENLPKYLDLLTMGI
jgi:hypothetical protein